MMGSDNRKGVYYVNHTLKGTISVRVLQRNRKKVECLYKMRDLV